MQNSSSISYYKQNVFSHKFSYAALLKYQETEILSTFNNSIVLISADSEFENNTFHNSKKNVQPPAP